MQKTSALTIPVQANFKSIALFSLAIMLPNLLGLVNIPTAMGFKIHFFQIAIMLAAIIYGPFGGTLSGLVGSIYSAVVMSNPFLIVGNMILGFFSGLFIKRGLPAVAAILLAFVIQLSWLIATDFYLMHMPATLIRMLTISLVVSNIIWAVVAHYLARPLKKVIE
jgi:uncharacterized membrane protein